MRSGGFPFTIFHLFGHAAYGVEPYPFETDRGGTFQTSKRLVPPREPSSKLLQLLLEDLTCAINPGFHGLGATAAELRDLRVAKVFIDEKR